MRPRPWGSAWAALCAVVLALPPQPMPALRAVASLDTLLSNSVFYHGKSVSMLATPAEVQGLWRIPLTGGRAFVITWKDRPPPQGPMEIHGLFYDVGRFAEDDSRLSAYGIAAIVRAVRGEGWPPRETLFVLLNATWKAAPDPTDTGLRAVVLDPSRFDGKPVTVVGRFRGQNLYGDEPMWPRQSQWDFVLQSADASIWVTGLRPRGKDFDFDPRSRRNTDSWLAVTGVLHLAQGLPYVAAQTLKTTAEIVDAPTGDVEMAPALAPPAVVFTAPAEGEVDVSPTSVVRVQFTRDMNPDSFERHITVTYGPPPAGATDVPPKFSVTYRPGSLALEMHFDAPLARFTTITVELGEGIVARDGTALSPTRLKFTTGG